MWTQLNYSLGHNYTVSVLYIFTTSSKWLKREPGISHHKSNIYCIKRSMRTVYTLLWCGSHRTYPYHIITHWGQRQNGRYSADDIFKSWMKILKFRLKFPWSVPKDTIHIIKALVQTMVWCRPGDKPLSETIMAGLLTHICVTRLKWVEYCFADTAIIIILDQCQRSNMGNESHTDIVDYNMSITKQTTTRLRTIFVISCRILWIHSLSGLFAVM